MNKLIAIQEEPESTKLPVEETRKPYDMMLIIAVILLLGFGAIAILSASGYEAMKVKNNNFYFFYRHLFIMGAGVLVAGFLAWLPRKYINKLHYPALIVCILLLGYCAGYGQLINGSRRWIKVLSATIQPMEFTRVAVVLYFGYFMSAKQNLFKEAFSEGIWSLLIRGVCFPLVIIGIICLLLLLQPDFGGTSIILLIFLAMLLIGKLPLRMFVLFCILAGSLFILLVTFSPYRVMRILAFIDPFDDPQGKGYQLCQSLFAFGRGGIKGVGFSNSIQKYGSLPEAHNDFIMSIIGEELGFVGIVAIMILFAFLFIVGFRIALCQKDLRSRITAYGLTMVIAISYLMNFAVVLGAAPTKGVAMPFFSYGGSSLLSNMICVGLLLNYSTTMRE